MNKFKPGDRIRLCDSEGYDTEGSIYKVAGIYTCGIYGTDNYVILTDHGDSTVLMCHIADRNYNLVHREESNE